MQEENKYKRKIIKLLKWLLYSVVILFVIMYLLLRLSSTQTYIASKLADYISDKAGVEVSIGKLDISEFLKISICNIKVRDNHDSLFMKVKCINAEIVPSYFIENKLYIKNLTIDSAFLALIEYKGEKDFNLMHIINAFSTDNDDDTSSSEFYVESKNLIINNSYFALDIQNAEHYDEMDYTHLNVDSINISISDFTIKTDSLIGKINYLSLSEKCGFRIDSLSGNVLLSPRELEIPNFYVKANSSLVKSNFNLTYSRWSDWIDFIDKVKFNSVVDTISLNMNDIRFYTNSVKNVYDCYYGTATISGSVSNLKIKNADMHFMNKTYFKGDVSLRGLPEIDQTFISIKAQKAVVLADELEEMTLIFDRNYSLPQEVKKLGNVRIKGRFTGFYYDFVSRASFNSTLGHFSTDVSIQPTANSFRYSGKLSTNNFQISKLTGVSYISNATMTATIKGVGLSRNADAVYDINFKKIVIAGFTYNDIKIKGDIKEEKITAELFSNRKEFRLSAKGFYDFADSIPHVFLETKLNDARVNRLAMVDKDTLGHISTHIVLDIIGSDIDNIEGYIDLYDLDYQLNGQRYYTDSVTIKSYLQNSFREITLLSNSLSIDVNGFRRVSDLPKMYDLLIHNILPRITNFSSLAKLETQKWRGNKEIYDEKLNFDIKFLDINSIINVFIPEFSISKDSEIKGSYSFFNDSLWLNMDADYISYDKFIASKLSLDLNKNNSEVKLDLSSNYLRTIGGVYFDTLNVDAALNLDTADFSVKWGNFNDFKNNGNFAGRVFWLDTNYYKINFDKGEYYVNDSLWKLNTNTSIISSHHFLKISDFILSHADNNLSISGQVSNNKHDKLVCEFNNFDISFLDFYLERFDTDLDGIINGDISLSSIWSNINFNANMTIDSFSFNKTYLNSLKIKSMYSSSRDAILMDIECKSENNLKYIDLAGFYYPFKDNNQLDFEVHLNKYPLSSIQSYLTSFTSKIDGDANGKLRIKGSLDKPILLGRLRTNINDVLVDYTNVHYKIDDYFVFTPTYFGFIDVLAEDMQGKNLRLNTKISHDFFRDFKLHIDVQPINAQLLNTEIVDNELFYGNAYGNGRFQMDGSFSELALKLRLSPNNKSYIAIPISSQSSAENSNFLTFVTIDTINNTNKINTHKKEEELKITLDMELDIDPSTTIELVMDEKVGDIISAHGSGKIKMVYDADENFKMFGKYTIDRGNYLFTMQGILNKRFTIQSGSEIVWDGEMENAMINLKAVYRVDAKLYDLFQSIVDSASSTVYKKPSKVNCIINISGSLFDPSISFDIKLPDESISDQELMNRLLSVESTGNSEELNKNFVSLLILGRFQPPSGYEAGANPNMLTHNATELLAEQVGNILNQVTDDVEIGLEWSPGDEVTTSEVALALSYNMLDDRLILDGKFGSGGGSTSEESTRYVADMEIAYKLTPDGRIRVKVFNRTNYYDPLSRKNPYTQGVGISFRKDFNSLYELFKPSSKKNPIDKDKKLKKNAEDKKKVKDNKKETKQVEQTNK